MLADFAGIIRVWYLYDEHPKGKSRDVNAQGDENGGEN